MLIIVSFFVFVLALSAFGVLKQRSYRGRKVRIGYRSDDYDAWATLAWVVSVVMSVIMLIVWSTTYLSSYSNNMELVAHQEAVIQEFADCVTYSKKVIAVDVRSITDFRVPGFLELVKDLRDATAEYNNTLLIRRQQEKSLIYNWFIAEPPDTLQVIRFIDGV